MNHADEIHDELRVKEIGFDEGPVARPTIRPNLPVLGPRVGSRVNDIVAALRAGDFEELDGGRIRVAGLDLGPDELLRGERIALEGWAVADEGPISLALDTELDDELRLEGRVLDLIRTLNDLRKAAGLELTDRIRVTLPPADAELLGHAERIKDEVLALSLHVDGSATEPVIARA